MQHDVSVFQHDNKMLLIKIMKSHQSARMNECVGKAVKVMKIQLSLKSVPSFKYLKAIPVGQIEVLAGPILAPQPYV